jgi:ParB/RepB/Spo0J family partition protein
MEVQKIPMKLIRPNPNNPRPFIKPEDIKSMSTSLSAIGQQTAVKLRLLTDAEKKADPDHDYELVGGHIRYEGAKALGWKTLDATVQSLTPDQAELAALMDNRNRDMHWIAWYQAIEKRLQTPGTTQQKVADELEISQSTVNRAVKLMGFLTPDARRAIYQTLINGTNEVPENPVYLLTGLADAAQVERALLVVLDRQMTEPEVKRLVSWVKKGNSPESFPQKGEGGDKAKEISDDPQVKLWANLPKAVKVTKTKTGYKVEAYPTASEVGLFVYGAMSPSPT